jgi:hypothetical protein
MAIGNTPQNQLDALPLIGASQVANPTDVVVIGGNVVKFWDENALGINGIQRNNAGDGSSNLFTTFLDFRGMNSANFLIARTFTTSAVPGDSINIFPLYRFGAFGNMISNAQIGAYAKPCVVQTFPTTPAGAPATDITSLGWSNTVGGVFGGNNGLPMSADIFFALHWTVPNDARFTWTVRLYAQSC